MSDEESEASARISWHGINALVFGILIFFASTGLLGVLLVCGSLVFWIGGTVKINNEAAAEAKKKEEMAEQIRLYNEEKAEKATALDAAATRVDAARVANDRAFSANELNNTAETTLALCGTHTAFIKATDALKAATAAYEKAVNR
jgi:hypothetical protein